MLTRLALLLALVSLSACSFSLDHPQSTMTIDVQGPSSKLELFPGSHLFDTEPPSNSSQFDCLVVNVVGIGIAPTAGPEEQYGFLDSLYQGHTCTYPGVSAIIPNSGTTRVNLKVPSGPKRIVQVGGVVKGMSNMCELPTFQEANNGIGLALFELGRTVTDLFRDSGVKVDETYNQDSPANQAERLMTCGTSGGAAAYLSMIENTPGILSYWPLNETVGTTAADQEVGVIAGAVGNMTLGTFTSTDGPPGIGLPAIHAGLNGIGATTGASFGTGNFSVEFWVRYTGTCNAANGTFFIMRHNGAALIQFKCTSTDHVLFVVEDNVGPVASVTSTNSVNNGDWHHVAGVKQGNTLALYVDAGTPDTGGTSWSGDFNFTVPPIHTNIGFDGASFQPADYADVAIYSTALTAAQVTDRLTSGD